MDKPGKKNILIVDDELGVRASFRMVLKDAYRTYLAGTGEEANRILEKNQIDVILLDVLLPDANGLDLLKKFKEIDPSLEVIMVTAVNEVKTAVQAIKAGAYEYISKPFVVEDVLTVIDRALENRRLQKKVAYLENELEQYQAFEKMVGNDPRTRNVFELISIVSKKDGTVLIQGESGTGKELVARAIHTRSPRHNQPFVVVNCASIPAALMESEIFGHTKGAFTGALNTKIGKLEIADGGTVFFDDIDCLSIGMQANLLRIIQEREFEKLGSNKVVKVDLRFIAATNKDLRDLISKGLFREDLYYRLNVFPIFIPPLRDRKSDIPLLVKHFLEKSSRRSGSLPKQFSTDAIELMVHYDWPGNVRELENYVERFFTIIDAPVIRAQDLSGINPEKTEVSDVPLKEAVNAFEKQYVANMLESFGWNRTKTAGKLGIHRNTLLLKINDLGIEKSDG